MTADEIHGDYVKSLVVGTDTTKASIESRGAAIITTAGTLVTLLFGLVAVLTKVDKFELPRAAHGPLAVALILFIVAVVLGIMSNIPLPYKNVDPAGLDQLFDLCWDEPEEDARLRIAVTHATIFRRAQTINKIKSRLVVGGQVFELGAVIALALAIGEVIQHA
jgi:hypothetical protein